jgi:hypothetical protein
MIAAFLLALLAQAPATPPVQMDRSVAEQAAFHERIARLLFYRLQHFQYVAARQGCIGAQPERTRALDARYDAVERRVVALSGPVLPHSGAEHRPDGYDDDCRRGVILNGYDNALSELEMHLAGTRR